MTEVAKKLIPEALKLAPIERATLKWGYSAVHSPPNILSGNSRYRALCRQGKKDVRVDTVDEPVLQDPHDAMIRVTATAICGSDLHLYGALVHAFVLIHWSLPMPNADCHALLANPHTRLSGTVDQVMYDCFRQQLGACPANGPIVITLSERAMPNALSARWRTYDQLEIV